MSDEEITVVPAVPEEVAPEATDTDGEPFDRKRAEEKIAKVNREAAALRVRLKELEPLAQQARELEDAQKTEAERLTGRLTAAEQRAVKAEQELLLRDVATEKGLTLAQAKRLVGTTREELLADADDFIASLPTPPAAPAPTPPAVQRTPVEALRPGALPTPPEPTIREQIAAAQKAGDFKTVIRLNGQLLSAQSTN